MRLIVGLGNPGDRYAQTRHNVGSRTLERAAARWAIPLKPIGVARQGRGLVGPPDKRVDVTLALPLAWMNQSGPAVKAMVEALGLSAEQLPDHVIVVHDDLDLPLGRLRIKCRGGPGGHNGILSLITTLDTDEFCRVKLGVGRPPVGIEAADYVLAPFLADEGPQVDAMIEQAVLALECLLAEGVAVAMNQFNAKEPMADGE
ncbi:MAG: aminoacyl-tRNA hydrolase [Nitrospirae bacterium]|nr:MAG: aminoacyl-tRNA hydrolase [Nitrospirota bacterium]